MVTDTVAGFAVVALLGILVWLTLRQPGRTP